MSAQRKRPKDDNRSTTVVEVVVVAQTFYTSFLVPLQTERESRMLSKQGKGDRTKGP